MARAGLEVSARGTPGRSPDVVASRLSDRRRLWDWVRQQRLLPGLLRLRDQCAAVAIGRGDEARGHVVAKQRNLRDVGSLLHRQGTAGVATVR